MTDPQGFIQEWSQGAEDIFGWTAAEATGQSASIIFTPEDRAEGADFNEFAVAAAQGSALDKRWHIGKDGRRVFMNGSMNVLPPRLDGQPQGFIKIARDELARHRAEEALNNLNATLEQRVVTHCLLRFHSVFTAFSQRLSRLLRLPDTAARLGSDEFVVVIDDFESHASVEAVAKHILISAMTKFQLNGHDCQVLASIGIALHGPKCADVDLLIKAADAAMYAAKRNGKNGFQFYDEASRT